jgi:uncharacterized membrane protein
MNSMLPRTIFALGMLGLGVLTLFYGDFALNWQPVPDWVPARRVLVYVSACGLLGGGAALLWGRSATRGALFLMVYLAIFWVLPQLLKAAPKPASIGLWLGFCETVGVMSGAGMIWSQSLRNDAFWQMFARLFGACCVLYGLSHFAYAEFTASMVPAWLPQRLWLAYATGAVHVAAGLAMLLSWQTRSAAWVEGIMMSSFVLLVHLPSLWMQPPPAWGPTLRTELTPLFWAGALAATALLIAGGRDLRLGSGNGARA